MAEKIMEITDSSFEQDVLQCDKPVLVDFWAPWCGPCKAITPAIEALSDRFDDRFQFVKCNVDDNPEIPAKYGIKSIPTLMFFKGGTLVDQITGMTTQGKIEEAINSILADKPSAQPFVMQ